MKRTKEIKYKIQKDDKTFKIKLDLNWNNQDVLKVKGVLLENPICKNGIWELKAKIIR